MSQTNVKRKRIVKVHPERLHAFLQSSPRLQKKQPPKGTATAPIAPGFTPDASYDLQNFTGKTIQNLSFANVYLGASPWAVSDMSNIDSALSGAMADPRLNNVIQQYFENPISCSFLGSKPSGRPIPATYTRDSVSQTLEQLYAAGQLAGSDFPNMVVNLLLPRGIILDSTGAGGAGKAESKDSSLQGLGGYHGSHQLTDGTLIYFACAVYSEKSATVTNGIPVWPDSWKNVVATLYHELVEARTDADVEAVNLGGAQSLLGWYSDKGGEIGDIPIEAAGNNLDSVFVEVTLQSGQSAPIQLMWSNAAHGPGEPF